MRPAGQTANDPVGCLIQLPQLGLPDPAGEFKRVLVAIGERNECFHSFEGKTPSDATLRPAAACYKIIEVDINGIVWLVPTSLRASSQALPELFSTELQRFPASAMPPGERAHGPDNTEWGWLSHEGGKLVMDLGGFTTNRAEAWFGPKESDEKLVKEMEETFGLQDLSIEGLQLFRRCSETTPSQCAPPRKPKTKGPAEAVQLKRKEKQATDAAWKIWAAMAGISFKEEWKREVHQEGLAAGWHVSPFFDPESINARFRISPEKDGNVRGMDYAVCGNDERPSAEEAEWKPIPANAVNPKWVRCGVNLMRYALGKRLFTEEDWPPRPTSLMLDQMGQKGEGK